MYEMTEKLSFMNRLSPDAYGIANLDVEQICDHLAKKTYDSTRIWSALHSSSAFGVDFFYKEIIKNYRGHIIDDKATMKKIMSELKEDCEF